MRRDAGKCSLPAHEEFSAILRRQYLAHRDVGLQDVYKLIYQRVFGPEHSIDNFRAALQNLYMEVLHLTEPPIEVSVVEPISPTLCRINLYPYMQQGGAVTTLWAVFRQTLRDYQPGTVVDLEYVWQTFYSTSWARLYSPAHCEQFWQQMATANFPPVHHSQAYREANTPH